MLKTQIFEKCNLSSEKINGTFFLVLSSMGSLREHFIKVQKWGRRKEPFLKETKTGGCENETKPPTSKKRQNRRFCGREQIAMKIVSLIKTSWPNYHYSAFLLTITFRKRDTTNLRQFPSLFLTNKFSRMPTPKILLKPALPFNLNWWYPPPIFCVPNSSESGKPIFGSFLLIPPPPPLSY